MTQWFKDVWEGFWTVLRVLMALRRFGNRLSQGSFGPRRHCLHTGANLSLCGEHPSVGYLEFN